MEPVVMVNVIANWSRATALVEALISLIALIRMVPEEAPPLSDFWCKILTIFLFVNLSSAIPVLLALMSHGEIGPGFASTLEVSLLLHWAKMLTAVYLLMYVFLSRYISDNQILAGVILLAGLSLLANYTAGIVGGLVAIF